MKVLFVCTGNTGRSAMAAGIFRKMTSRHKSMKIRMARVWSAGISANEGDGPEELAKVVMKEREISLDIHTAVQVTSDLLQKHDLILTMEAQQRDTLLSEYNAPASKTFLLTEYVGEEGDIEDCYGQDKEVYVQCADRLFHLIDLLVQKMMQN